MYYNIFISKYKAVIFNFLKYNTLSRWFLPRSFLHLYDTIGQLDSHIYRIVRC